MELRSPPLCQGPNLGWFWSPDAISPERMARMQCAAYDAVKAQSPTTRVAAPGIAPMTGSDLNNSDPKLRRMDWRDYMRRMYVAMGRVCWDVFSVHPYMTSVDLDHAGGELSQFYADLRALRSQYGDPSRVFLTELGWPTSGQGSFRFDDSPKPAACALGSLILGVAPDGC